MGLIRRLKNVFTGKKNDTVETLDLAVPTATAATTLRSTSKKGRLSRRARGAGLTLAGGKNISPYDLHLMSKRGCNLEKLADALNN